VIAVLGFVLLGIAVGALSSFLGVGGGVILVAVLVAATDFTQHEAQATALAFMVPTAMVGLLSVRRHGLGDLRSSLVLGTSGAAAAVGGALLALALPGDMLRDLFATFIGILGLVMLLRPARPSRDPIETTSERGGGD
jgi:uncharacterized membrane protein YfcA